ncbi:transglutaminase-like cysteine peptidase [Roseospira marina]|nr:transglutaminase-like cysteine peptidase [Roseospira marina]MBB4312955.1 putative transglutaminase-like cysteine proteinase [Roseospira marina]MBB5086272.1 putative transglutaminase-like cysteine proteinase [Roseospira marina]
MGSMTLVRFVLVCAVMLAVGAAGSVPAQAGGDRVFGQDGRMMRSFRPIPQWRTLMLRYQEEERRNARCAAAGGGSCPYTEWQGVIARLRGKDPMTQLREINRFANHWQYITDPVNWGQPDYWATPGEFFAKAGDCEDYAIVKFMSLRALGFANADLKLVAVQDLNLRIGHAVTIVSLGGRDYLLDNQITQVIDSSSVRHYKPVFAANEEVWWLYR